MNASDSVAETVDLDDTGWVDLPLDDAKAALENWHTGGAERLDVLFDEAAQAEGGEDR